MTQIDAVLTETLKQLTSNRTNSPTSEPKSPTDRPINLAYLSMERLGVPPLYCKAHIKQFPQATIDALGPLDSGECFFLSGPTGTGKTHLAVAILKRWVALGLGNIGEDFDHILVSAEERSWVRVPRVDAMFISVPDMLRSIMKEFDGGNPDAKENKYRRTKLMVLDDLGAEKTSEWTFSALYGIIAHRINWQLPTIVTSNLSLKELNQWEPRIASRLGGMKVVELGGDDLRLKREDA